jgi:hypothetical protein
LKGAGTESEIEAAFTSLVQSQTGALVVGGDPFLSTRRDQLVALASRDTVPAICLWRELAEAGGLLSPPRCLGGACRAGALGNGLDFWCAALEVGYCQYFLTWS